MFTRLKWHFSGINTHFRPTISLFSTFFAVVSSPFSSISNVNISLSYCLLDRKQISFPFFSTALYFRPKEAILRRLGNQNVILILPLSAYGISKAKGLSCGQRTCQRPTGRKSPVRRQFPSHPCRYTPATCVHRHKAVRIYGNRPCAP